MAEKKINTVLYDIDQSSDTTDLQKATARANIGAQAELTAGENIEIDPDTNTISSTSAPQVVAHDQTLVGDGTSSDPLGVDEVEVGNSEMTTIYDLTGRRLEQVAIPGIYVVNGKKMFVK